MLPDVNIWVAAFRRDHPHHLLAQDWLKQALADSSSQTISLALPIISSFIRLVTNPKIFNPASTSAQAVDFIDWLIEDPRIRIAASGQEWLHFRQLVLDKSLSVNQISDAHLAALSQHLGEPLVTFDKDFRKLLPRSLLQLLVVTY